jgi:alanyl-tRNA synthetase
MDAHELREAFLRFFEERGHRRMAGAPLVPPGDPTLLFTSAGMVQFKPYFMGQSKPPSTRLASVQKCFRTTDIESAGDTKHLTFFEMLGNFSVGDYFKAEMIPWAWEFVTDVLKVPPERLWTSVYLDDDEAYELWRKVGVPEERIRRYGEEENYWFSGEIGPCGPCSEIYYDFGEQFGCGPACEPSHECGRFLEIWNLVFMSYYCDGEEKAPLPSKNIDTGSGLERVATVLLFESEGWDKNRLASPYDTDLFRLIIQRIEELSGEKYGEDEQTDRAMRIVAEHSRAVTCLIGDERTPVLPSNEERGYVVRRMLRRAVYFGRRQLGIEELFMAEMVDTAVQTMAVSYPELERTRGFVKEIVGPEEQRFDETLSRGLEMLDSLVAYRKRHRDAIRDVLRLVDERGISPENASAVLEQHGFTMESGEARAARFIAALLFGYLQAIEEGNETDEQAFRRDIEEWGSTIAGEEAFELHDTYGFPIELTREIAGENGMSVDEIAFEEQMDEQRQRARAAGKTQLTDALREAYSILGGLVHQHEPFVGYDTLETFTPVMAVVRDGQLLEEITAGPDLELLLDETPFYPEGGGQVADRGILFGPNGMFEVADVQSVAQGVILHRGRTLEGTVQAGERVTARVDPRHRADTMRNHTATHLLHAALRKVLGTHVRQAGSLVAPDRLRFDFTHAEPVTAEQLAEVERLVNEKVRQNLPVHTRLTSFDKAMSEGVLAFFGEKYGEEVRVVEVNTVVPRFSAELCGGTHCERTGDVGFVLITGESSIGAGMRRIEALSGRGAEEYVRQKLAELDEASRRVGGGRVDLIARIDALVAEKDALQKRAERLERSLATAPALDQITNGAIEVDGVKVVASQLDLPSVDALRYSADAVRKSMPSGVAVLGSVIDGRPQFVAIVSPDVIPKGPKAGEILKRVAAVAGGGGGGRPEMAQGGGKDASKIGEALAIVPEAVREMLSGNGPRNA